MFEIKFSDSALKELTKLEKGLQERIIATLERIRIRPESYVKRLVGDTAYRLRVGDYRILMDIQKEELIILVIKIGHRSKVYN